MGRPNANSTPRREELLHALFGQPGAAGRSPVFPPAELERMFATDPAREGGGAPAGRGIDPEMIAALLEGALGPEERDHVLRTLARDDQAFDQFLTAARFRLGRPSPARTALASPEDTSGSGSRTRTAVRWLLPLAAGLALLVLLPRVLPRDGEGLPSGQELIALAEGPVLGFTPFELVRPELRSAPPVEPGPRVALFELGVRTVDLAWLAQQPQAGDQLRAYAARVAGLVESAEAPAAAGYEALAEAPEEQTPSPRQVALAEAELTGLVSRDPPIYDFGRWTEAARLAAQSRSESFFRDIETWDRPLTRFRRLEPDPDLRGLLDELLRARRRPPDYESIEVRLETILAHCLSGGDCLGQRPGD